MHIVIAPDSFKESLSAIEVASAIRKGLSEALDAETTFDCVPLADGGEGTIDTLHEAIGGELITAPCIDPLGRPHSARYLLLPDATAVIELAEASGLALLESGERDPRITTTRGSGMLMKAAIEKGARTLLICLGGSATCDGATGIAREFGYRFLDTSGNELPDGGAALTRLAAIDSSECDPVLSEVKVRVACDVKNPLCGNDGAAKVFAPQKGADAIAVNELEQALMQLASCISGDANTAEVPGAGAAGGCGFGLSVFFKASLENGFNLVAEAVELDQRIAVADLVITGEGRCDYQTLSGKVPFGVAGVASTHGVPVVLFAGELGNGWKEVMRCGIHSIIPITPGPLTLEESIRRVKELLESAAFRTGRLLAHYNLSGINS